VKDFAATLARFTGAVVAGKGKAVAECFAPDGVYHDVFYGRFKGRAAISDLIENHFHRDGADFRWDMHDPVNDGDRGYARYMFSYRPRRGGGTDQRAIFEGVAMFRFDGELFADFSEITNAATGLSMTGADDARLARFIAKQADELLLRDDAQGHLSQQPDKPPLQKQQ